MRGARSAIAAVTVLAAGAACRPDLGARESLVDGDEILAVRAEPAEARPGEPVTFSLLVASPTGTVAGRPVAWAFCATPKRLGENGAVSAACAGDGVTPVDVARGDVTTAVPEGACFDFGPETRSADLRPRDPDVTGGYYAPIRASVAGPAGGLVAFGFARLRCNLAGAPAEIARDFAARYAPNRNPTITAFDAPIEAAPGARVTARVSWRPEDAETYLRFDPSGPALLTERESLRVSWHTTGGAFDSDRTGRGEAEAETSTESGWTAPAAPGVVHLWAVLRDARGGVAWASRDVAVR